MFKRFIARIFWWSIEDIFDDGMMAGAQIGIIFERDRVKQLIKENSIQYRDSTEEIVIDEICISASDLIRLLDKDQVF
jgi:hypothetical protein